MKSVLAISFFVISSVVPEVEVPRCRDAESFLPIEQGLQNYLYRYRRRHDLNITWMRSP